MANNRKGINQIRKKGVLGCFLIILVAAHTARTKSSSSEENPKKPLGKPPGKVIMLIEMARHGARAPLFQATPTNWPEEFDLAYRELLPSGRRQHYLAGLNLKKTYPGLFKEPLKISEYHASTSERNRTFESAFSRLLPLTTKEGIKTGKNPAGHHTESSGGHSYPKFVLNDLILHSRPSEDDPLTRPMGGLKNCKKLVKYKMKRTQSMKDRMSGAGKLPDFLSNLQKLVNRNPLFQAKNTKNRNQMTFFEAAMIGDELYSLHRLDNSTFETKNSNYQKIFSEMKMINQANHLLKYYDKTLNQVLVSPFLTELKTQIFKKYFSVTDPEKAPYEMKYRLYSTHDTTFSPLLLHIGHWDRKCVIEQAINLKSVGCVGKVPTASNLRFELIEEAPDRHFVVTRLNGDPINFCDIRPNDIEEDDFGTFKCSPRRFWIRLDQLIDQKWEERCENFDPEVAEKNQKMKFFFKVLVCVLGLVCSLSLAYSVYLSKRVEAMKLVLKDLEDGGVEVPEGVQPGQYFVPEGYKNAGVVNKEGQIDQKINKVENRQNPKNELETDEIAQEEHSELAKDRSLKK